MSFTSTGLIPSRAATSSKDSGIPDAGNKAEITALSRFPSDCFASSTLRVALASLFEQCTPTFEDRLLSRIAFKFGSEETTVTLVLRRDAFRVFGGGSPEASWHGSTGFGAESLGNDFCRRAIDTPVGDEHYSSTVSIGPGISQTLGAAKKPRLERLSGEDWA
jgi:hypothetical protein